MIKRLGVFGEFVKQYEKARRPYKPEVYNFLKKFLSIKKPYILDLGCGTGISTRPLASFSKVVGCDPDIRMLQAARKHKDAAVEKYVVGSAAKLPFKDASFDVVTAFSAFHWFDNKKDISEIKRVLKPGGILFVANKTGLKSWGEGYRRAIIKTIKNEIAHFREDSYDPKKSLVKNGFKKIKVKRWKESEIYTLAQALEYVQSVSIWSTAPENLRDQAWLGVKKYFQNMKARTGKIERKYVVRAVIGIK